MTSRTYFPFLHDIFAQLLHLSWRTAYIANFHQLPPDQLSPFDYQQYIRCLFPALMDVMEVGPLSPPLSSMSTETLPDLPGGISTLPPTMVANAMNSCVNGAVGNIAAVTAITTSNNNANNTNMNTNMNTNTNTNTKNGMGSACSYGVYFQKTESDTTMLFPQFYAFIQVWITFIHSLIHSFIHPLIHSFTHSLIHPFIHSLTSSPKLKDILHLHPIPKRI